MISAERMKENSRALNSFFYSYPAFKKVNMNPIILKAIFFVNIKLLTLIISNEFEMFFYSKYITSFSNMHLKFSSIKYEKVLSMRAKMILAKPSILTEILGTPII